MTSETDDREGNLPLCLMLSPGARPRTVVAADRDGRLHHIDTVAVGTPGLACLDCRAEVRARKPKKGAHHFYHLHREECRTAGETALHLMAKAIITREMRLMLPPLRAVLEGEYEPLAEHVLLGGKWEDARRFEASPGGAWLDLAHVEIEPWRGGLRPDLIVRSTRNPRPLHVEILVTHAVDDGKRAEISTRGESMIEIDLSRIERGASSEAIARAVLETAPRRWVFNPAIVERQDEMRRLREAEEARWEEEFVREEAERERKKALLARRLQAKRLAAAHALVRTWHRAPKRTASDIDEEILRHLRRCLDLIDHPDFLHGRWPAGGAFEGPIETVRALVFGMAVVGPLEYIAARSQHAPGPVRWFDVRESTPTALAGELDHMGWIKPGLGFVKLKILQEAVELNQRQRVVPAGQAITAILDDLFERDILERTGAPGRFRSTQIRESDRLQPREWLWDRLAPYLLHGEVPGGTP